MDTSIRNKGIVKLVLSGDSVVIRGKPVNGPPPERTLSLAFLSAPRLAKRPNDKEVKEEAPAASDAPAAASSSTSLAQDEPFAWQSREFLRTRLVGKEVSFSIEYSTRSGRDFGWLFVGDENINNLLVAEGMAKVRPPTGSAEKTEAFTELEKLETEAQAAAKGVWSSSSSAVRHVNWKVDNQKAFVERYQGKQIDAIIEQVRDATTLRLLLLPDFTHITIQLAGIKAPGYKRVEGTDKEVAEPFADEAKFLVESRLLQKEIKVVIEGIANQNAFVGSIIHPAGNISELLLRDGFAKCVDWSMGMVTLGRDKYRAAEKAAKEKRVRLWKNYVATNVSGSENVGKEFQGTVVEIVNGETVAIRTPDDQIVRASLSSLRQPRPESADAGGGSSSSGASPSTAKRATMFDIPYAFECREFLRKRLLGRKIKYTVDFVKPPADGFPAKTGVSIVADGVNIGDALVSRGLATVMRHRADDEYRASNYDDLLASEGRAQKSNKGVFGKKADGILKINDLTGDTTKAKGYMPFLQRAGRVNGIIEHVGAGSRFRIYCPRENCMFTFLLSCITSPRPSRSATEPGQPFGDEALAFARERLLQRDVEISAESMDKSGGVIGTLYLNDDNFAVALVEEGFASVHPSADRSQFARQLNAAQDHAKSKKLRIWKNYDAAAEAAAKAAAASEVSSEVVDDTVSERRTEYKEAEVTEIADDGRIFFQYSSDSSRLSKLMDDIASHCQASNSSSSYSPKINEICGAQFSDGVWYRAKVLKIASPKEIHVHYIDYGNSEIVLSERVTSLPSQITSPSAFAQEASVAFLGLPRDEDDKAEFLSELAATLLNKRVLVNIEYKRDNRSYVTIVDTKTKSDIGRTFVEDGLAMLDKRRERRFASLMDSYEQAQNKARKEHLNIWKYGDFTNDE